MIDVRVIGIALQHGPAMVLRRVVAPETKLLIGLGRIRLHRLKTCSGARHGRYTCRRGLKCAASRSCASERTPDPKRRLRLALPHFGIRTHTQMKSMTSYAVSTRR